MNEPAPRLLQALQQLPEHDAPTHLWSRVLESRLNEERRRSRRMAMVGGALAAALVLAVALPLTLQQQSPAMPAAQTVTDLMLEARLMEERLANTGFQRTRLQKTPASLLQLRQAELSQLDEALATAYAQNASPEVLERLWRERVSLLNEMLNILEAGAGAI